MEYCYFHPPSLSKIIDFPINFPWIFHVFSEPLPESILGAQNADLCSKGRFLDPFWISRGSKIRPLGPIFGKKASKKQVPRITGGVLGPSLRPTTPQNHPGSHFSPFLQIFNEFGTNYDGFSKDLERSIMDFGSSIDFGTKLHHLFFRIFPSKPATTQPNTPTNTQT